MSYDVRPTIPLAGFDAPGARSLPKPYESITAQPDRPSDRPRKPRRDNGDHAVCVVSRKVGGKREVVKRI